MPSLFWCARLRAEVLTAAAAVLAAAAAAFVAAGVAAGQPPRLDPQLEKVLNAVRDGEFEVMAAALEGGMEVDAKAGNGMTALHVAAVLGRERFVAHLLENGAAVDDPAQNGITPLNRAAMGGHLGTMRLLLDAGADVNAAARWGATPLLSAVDRGQIEAVSLLLAAGADPKAAARNGETALSLALKRDHRELAALLSEDPETLRAEGIAEAERRASRAATHHRTGVAFDDAGDIRRAIESYRLALEQEPQDPLVRYRLGRALHRFGEREALLHLIEAVRGWGARIAAGEELAPIAGPALEDACAVLESAGRGADAAACRVILEKLPR